jgi:hypothetical protein
VPIVRELVAITLSAEERAQRIAEVAALHGDLRDQGVEVICDVHPTPDGDLYLLAFEDVRAAA